MVNHSWASNKTPPQGDGFKFILCSCINREAYLTTEADRLYMIQQVHPGESVFR